MISAGWGGGGSRIKVEFASVPRRNAAPILNLPEPLRRRKKVGPMNEFREVVLWC